MSRILEMYRRQQKRSVAAPRVAPSKVISALRRQGITDTQIERRLWGQWK